MPFIWHVVLTKFLSFFNNTQSFVDNKSGSTSKLIKSKSRDLEKVLTYLSGIVTSVFKGGTDGCASLTCWDPPRFGGSCAGSGCLTSVFPFVFVFYLNNLLFETSLSTPSISSI